jgi:hypothetical protein
MNVEVAIWFVAYSLIKASNFFLKSPAIFNSWQIFIPKKNLFYLYAIAIESYWFINDEFESPSWMANVVCILH